MLRVQQEIKQKFFNYFDTGMTPSQAMNYHEGILLATEDSVQILSNSSINPTIRMVNYMYTVWRHHHLGSPADPFTKLEEKAQLYEENDASIIISKDSPWSVLIVTSVMKRTQEIMSAKEIIFVDTTSSCESTGSSLTVMLTATQAGAVPIAIIIHQCQTKESYKDSFLLLKENYPNCFGKETAPMVFMTDDSAAEKSALFEVWPSAEQCLCLFHVAQAQWRYLWSSNIPKEEKPKLMRLFQNVMYSITEETMTDAAAEIFAKEGEYPEFVQRFRAFFQNRRHEWVLHYRHHLIMRNNNTDNYAEATIRIIKDIVLSRTKAFNVVALVDFCVFVWNNYLTAKLLNVAHNRSKTTCLLQESKV